VTANPFVGVIYHWLGGLAAASCYLPFRGIKRWSWETYWQLQGAFSWIVAPTLIASLLVPGLWSVLLASPFKSIAYCYFWGFLWGFGALTFGLSIRYLGIALGYPIALGLCTFFGTLMPPLFRGELAGIAHQTSGKFVLLGMAICLLGIVFSGLAGGSKERELSEEHKRRTVREFEYGKGLTVAIFAGVMSACFAYGLAAGEPIRAIAAHQLVFANRSTLWENLPVLVVVLLGGFTTNSIWCFYLLVRNSSLREFAGHATRAHATRDEETHFSPDPASLMQAELDRVSGVQSAALPVRLTSAALKTNVALAAAAGLIWYFQFFFYSMGQTLMGRFEFSSWTLHMASIIIFSTVWGIVIHEWRGTSARTRALVFLGLLALVTSTLVVGYGNYLQSRGHLTMSHSQPSPRRTPFICLTSSISWFRARLI
jgi:L-rhamnose-H+ transport protein